MKNSTQLLNEMIVDFIEDVSLKYTYTARRLGLPLNVPMTKLNRTIEKIICEFKRLRALYKYEFAEVLFRISVAKIAVISPTLSLVNADYAFRLAVQSIAVEYRPKNPPALAMVA